jgi:hypothetical protein
LKTLNIRFTAIHGKPVDTPFSPRSVRNVTTGYNFNPWMPTAPSSPSFPPLFLYEEREREEREGAQPQKTDPWKKDRNPWKKDRNPWKT